MIDELDRQVIEMLRRVNQQTLHRMQEPFQVATKTNYNDLVTSVDKQNEREIDAFLRRVDPDCQILSEEGYGNQQITSTAGHVWIVDPIDGTLNFVKQRNHFGIMLALYIDGQPTLGYIMDSMNEQLYHGGPGRGVFVNDRQLATPADLSLREGLVSISSPLILGNVKNLPMVAKAASGLRMYGSAAMEMIGILKGELAGYVSHLHPWDLAAGRAMAEELGLVVKSIDGTAPDVLSSNLVLIATKQVSREIAELTD